MLTERVCPLVIKLFSPSSKQRHMLSHSPLSSSMLQDKPSFALHIRLLRILRILIKQYFTLLVITCLCVYMYVCIIYICMYVRM